MQHRQTAASRPATHPSAIAGAAILVTAVCASAAEEGVPEQIVVRAKRVEKPLVELPAAVGRIEKDTIPRNAYAGLRVGYSFR
jgi:outer membrane cobalamin receptor